MGGRKAYFHIPTIKHNITYVGKNQLIKGSGLFNPKSGKDDL
jgi:hypothetical protein